MPKRIEWIDTAKGLGLLLVFIGHLHPPYISTWIYTFHMPLFFFLSGLVFTHHPLRTFVSKKFTRLIIPYFCLGGVIYLFYACVYVIEQRPASDYWQMLIDLISQKAFWTIWFLAALALGDIILWIELYLTRGRLLATLLISITIMSIAFIYYRAGGSTIYWCADVACVAQFFIMLGYLFKKNFERLEQWISSHQSWLLVGLFLIINIIAGFLCIRLSGRQLDMSVGLYGNEFLTIVSALSGIAFIVIICHKISTRFLTYLGQNTMIFFAWHSRIIIVACGMLYGAIGLFQENTIISQVLYTATTLIMIMAILYPATEGIKRTKLRQYFGV